MKKIIVSSLSLLIVVVGIITGKMFDNSKSSFDKKINQVEIIGVDQDESKEEKTEEEKQLVEDTEKVEDVKTNNEPTSKVKENKSQSVSQTPKSNTIATTKTEEQNKTQNSDTKNIATPSNSDNTQTEKKEEQKQPSDNGQKNIVSTTFYDSITHGQREFRTESEAFARGTQIQQNELNAVLDYNELHPDNQIQPDINYFRVYPSAIDENGNYWYYLHFFCVSGEGQDSYLKSKY